MVTPWEFDGVCGSSRRSRWRGCASWRGWPNAWEPRSVSSPDEGTERDVYVALTAIVTATERLIVGPAITNPFSRHPVATAAAIATLAELAPGRVWHGLGVGGSRVLDPLGVDPARPYTALKDAVDTNVELLSGGHVGSASLPWFDDVVPMAIAGRGTEGSATGRGASRLGDPVGQGRRRDARDSRTNSFRRRRPASAGRPIWPTTMSSGSVFCVTSPIWLSTPHPILAAPRG